ncbi:MAG: peptidase M28, partial [Thermomicrobiales bacterium]|nr:peptidase M28 [Thermomicrobiales bacterium]
SMLRVLNAPALPFDWRRTTAEFHRTLERYQSATGEDFSFSPATASLDALDEALGRFYAVAPAGDPGSPGARAFNAAQRELARLLVPVNYNRAAAFHHDSTYEPPPLPDLAPALTLPQVGADRHRRGIVQAHLLRGRNRLVWALEQARALIERAGTV